LKNIVITGCSTGIGQCLRKGLSKRDYRVLATCRKPSDVAAFQKIGIETIHLDLADANSVSAAIDEIRARCDDNIYGLINNGAYGQPGAVVDLDREVLREQFETNVFGTQQLTNGLLPMMIANGQGRVVQISSVLGFVCLRFRGAYNASKFALEALTDTMRLEHRGSGVYFSLVQPGPIESNFRRNAYAKFRQNIDREQSMFCDTYGDIEKRLNQRENARFTLSAEAVLKAVIHALESRSPKPRYPVTVPTHVMGVLKRVLPDRWMDSFLAANSDKVR
jgi:short-subunit dehydrogenase